MSSEIIRFSEHISLTLLLEKPRLHLIRVRSLKEQRNYARELQKRAKGALTRYPWDTQIAYLIAEGYQIMGRKDEATKSFDS